MRSSSCGRWRPGPIDGLAASVFVAMMALLSSANAAANARIETKVTPVCELAARDLEERLTQALGEMSARSLDVSVSIEREDSGYRVTLVTRDELAASRDKVILAPTCDEAVDAAVVVLALAASETAHQESAPAR